MTTTLPSTRPDAIGSNAQADRRARSRDNTCREHPIFNRIVCRIPGWKWNSSHEELLELAQTLRGVAFRPQEAA